MSVQSACDFLSKNGFKKFSGDPAVTALGIISSPTIAAQTG